MPILHFGVVDIPYAHSPRGVTTGDVASWLENRYHIAEHYWNLHQQEIADSVTRSLAGTIGNLMAGAPSSIDPFGQASSEIEDGFKQMLATGELDRLGYPGIPTKAAIDRASGIRRSPRFKSRRGAPTNAAPISFIATGLYQASFKAWFT